MTLNEAYELMRKEVLFLRRENAKLKAGTYIDAEKQAYEKEIYQLNKANATLKKGYDRYHELWKNSVKREESRRMEKYMVEADRDDLKAKVDDLNKQILKQNTINEDLSGTIMKLKAQLNRDYENSSIPSSVKPLHKKIKNSREKTNRKSGAQAGHKGHKRRRLETTASEFLEAPDNILNNSDYYKTGKDIHKQVIDVKLVVNVTDYFAHEYRNRKTGIRYHAPFPVANDVNYGSNVKTLAFLLNNYCNVSVPKTQEFIREMTDSAITMSIGMINQLSGEFSAKTEEDRKKIFATLLQAPVLYSDATVGRVNGKGKAVIVVTSKNETLYFFRDHKGHEGLKDTPIENYQMTIVHDHDKTYYNYGSEHQECLSHVLRYLKDSIDNETELTWNINMNTFIQKMLHEFKEADKLISETEIQKYETGFNEILLLAEEEYKRKPPSKFYKDGYNLYKRMKEYKGNHLYFLRHPEVDYTNNVSERCCRKYKRKQKQSVTFRSQKNAENLCNALSIIETTRMKGDNIYKVISQVFKKEIAPAIL